LKGATTTVQRPPAKPVYVFSGARPSSGAASSASSNTLDFYRRASCFGCRCDRGRARSAKQLQAGGPEMMNGSKPDGPSGGFQAPSPKRRRLRVRVSRSPSPRPSPPGEGETSARALVIRPRLVVVYLRNERQRSADCNRNLRIFLHGASALPLLGERAGVRGNESNSNARRTTIPGIVTLRESPGRAGGFPI